MSKRYKDRFSKYICDLDYIAITNPEKKDCANHFIYLSLYSTKENLEKEVYKVPTNCYKDKELLLLLVKALNGKFRNK